MRQKITPELRQVLIAALVDGSVGMKELGYTLQTIEGRAASGREKEDWNNYIGLDSEERNEIRLSLHNGFIDIDKLFGFSQTDFFNLTY